MKKRLQTAWKLLLSDVYRLRLPLVLLAAYGVWAQLHFGVICPSRVVLGRGCPGCGLTRAGFSLLRLDMAGAFAENPAIFLWAPYLFCLLLWRYWFQSAALSPSNKRGAALLIAVCALTWVVFLLRRAGSL